MTITRKVVTDANGEPILDENGRISVNHVVPPLPGEDIGMAVITGPHAKGVVTMADGTLYDISPEVIQVAQRHAGSPIGYRIAAKLAQDGVLEVAVHGKDYTGPTLVVVGDESAHHVAVLGSEDVPVGTTTVIDVEPGATPPVTE